MSNINNNKTEDEEIPQMFCKRKKHWADEDQFDDNPMTKKKFTACNECRKEMKTNKQAQKKAETPKQNDKKEPEKPKPNNETDNLSLSFTWSVIRFFISNFLFSFLKIN